MTPTELRIHLTQKIAGIQQELAKLRQQRQMSFNELERQRELHVRQAAYQEVLDLLPTEGSCCDQSEAVGGEGPGPRDDQAAGRD